MLLCQLDELQRIQNKNNNLVVFVISFFIYNF